MDPKISDRKIWEGLVRLFSTEKIAANKYELAVQAAVKFKEVGQLLTSRRRSDK